MKIRGGPAAVIGEAFEEGPGQPLSEHIRREGPQKPTTREPEDLLRREKRILTVKGFGGRSTSAEALFLLFEAMKGTPMKKSKKKDVIAFRKRCKAKGTGLSHYILMDRKGK